MPVDLVNGREQLLEIQACVSGLFQLLPGPFRIIIVLLSPLVAILVTTGDCGGRGESQTLWTAPKHSQTRLRCSVEAVDVGTCPGGCYHGDDDFAFLSASGYPSLVLGSAGPFKTCPKTIP